MAINSDKAVKAFYEFKERKFNHDSTTLDLNGNIEYRYRGNVIGVKNKKNELFITDCGWKTITTKDRLNNILPRDMGITQVKGKWYIRLYMYNPFKVIFEVEFPFNTWVKIRNGSIITKFEKPKYLQP